MSALSTALFLEHPEADPVFRKMSVDNTHSQSQNTSRKTSVDSQHSATPSEKHDGVLHKLAHKIAAAAKEHHKSVNSAFTAYYGLPVVEKKKEGEAVVGQQ